MAYPAGGALLAAGATIAVLGFGFSLAAVIVYANNALVRSWSFTRPSESAALVIVVGLLFLLAVYIMFLSIAPFGQATLR
jgi:hypothetical protein